LALIIRLYYNARPSEGQIRMSDLLRIFFCGCIDCKIMHGLYSINNGINVSLLVLTMLVQ